MNDKNWYLDYNGLDDNLVKESICSLGNGYMGLRGTLEEDYFGETHQGYYIGGVWFPDKTRVGWWKNGYPKYFGKAINCANLIGIHVYIDHKILDLNVANIKHFSRVLDMKSGVLKRETHIETDKGNVWIKTERFVSLFQKEMLALTYEISSDYDVIITLKPYIDGDVVNQDSNYSERFWQNLGYGRLDEILGIRNKTKPNEFGVEQFEVAYAMGNIVSENGKHVSSTAKDGYAEQTFEFQLNTSSAVAKLTKYVIAINDRLNKNADVLNQALRLANSVLSNTFEEHKIKHIELWHKRWDECDIIISNDDKAQQAVRFNLFQLLSTYSGEDATLNIGPKGFTGEKYGGATYWDTEAYCLPVYMGVRGKDVARQLLRYRHLQLPQAYTNAQMQGLDGALYPMVTFNGLECHNEWEITFEEIHRNAAIAYAIFNYTSYTDDTSYVLNDGFDVLCGIARFWVSRVHYNTQTKQYMIHGVTGPNEYENNVNNNWYTNRMAKWCLEYFLDIVTAVKEEKIKQHQILDEELKQMRRIAKHMYLPYNKKHKIFVQHDTFLDKDIKPTSTLKLQERPLNQHWSWDKILRSCFIKQADVLQGLYFLNHLYSRKKIKRNFDFYEPLTVHESSLSPCVHSILATQIDYLDKAYDMFMQTACLDLDNVNHDTQDGLHITSMAGSWLALVHGFAGLRTTSDIEFSPKIPKKWTHYQFRMHYRERILEISVDKENAIFKLIKGDALDIKVNEKKYNLNVMLSVSIL